METKKTITLLVLLLMSLLSCRSYLDKGRDIHNNHIDLIYSKSNNNKYIYRSNFHGSADGYIYYNTHFMINIPKNIVFWKILSTEHFFEYKNKQIIFIYSGYKNVGSSGNWILRDESKIMSDLFEYWVERGYRDNNLKINPNRITKVYTDGKVKILLFNIKKENFNNYLSLIKSFEYIDYKTK